MSQQPPPIHAVPVLPYATPPQYHTAALWRDGKCLVVRRKGVVGFPRQCVKCNADTHGYRANVRVQISFRLPLRLMVPLCTRHRAARFRWVLMSWLFGLSGVIGIGLGNSRFYTDLMGSSLGDAIGIVASLLTFLVGIWANIRAGVLRGKRIRGEYVWLRGAGEPFLDGLPSFNSR